MRGCDFVALSRFEVMPGWEDSVAEAFVARPHQVENAPGFVRLEVLRPADNAAEFWLLTFWTDEESFRSWHRSHDRKAAHAGMPPGLRLRPGSAELSSFELVTT
ncbi:MAG: antibiotic biosynthesis monooxygenase family protein [Nitriliruptoraceae bacterium]